MDIKLDDLVTFKKGLYADEERAIYRVIEINGDRCFIELINTSMDIRPQSVARITELSIFRDEAHA
jgi:hypothetical protein